MDKQPKCPLTHGGEARLRMAFGLLRSWTPVGLAGRLQQPDIGVATPNAARILISQGNAAGLLQRHGGRNGTYTLVAGWEHPKGPQPPPKPAPPPRAPARAKRLSAFALLGQVAAQRPGPLTPALGQRAHEGVDADGELLPCIGGRIVDALHSQFQAVFAGADQ